MDWGLAKDLNKTASAITSRAIEAAAKAKEEIDPEQTGDYLDSNVSGYHQTEMGVVLGTPSYMSPEQARGETLDARVDVFALGGILFSILTKAPPFMGKTSAEVIKKAAAADLVEANKRLHDCEADPDLIAICRQCLSPEPANRPRDGREVAEAITAYLSNMQARLQQAEISTAQAKERETAAKRTRKIQLIAASLIFTALAVGLGISLWQYRVATKALDRALFAEGEEKKRSGELSKSREQEKKRADDLVKSQAEEKQRADELSKVSKYQADMLQQLRPEEAGVSLMKDLLSRYNAVIDKGNLSDAEKASKKDAFKKELYTVNATDTAVQLIDTVILAPAVKTIDKEFAKQPVVDAKLRNSLAVVYGKLGKANESAVLAKRSYEVRVQEMGARHRDTLESRLQFAGARLALQELSNAEADARAAFEEYQKQFGEDDDLSLNAGGNLTLILEAQGKYDECEAIGQQILQRRLRQNPPDPKRVAEATSMLGRFMTKTGKYDDALKLLDQQLKTERQTSSPLIVTLSSFADVLLRKKEFARAEPYLRETLALNRSENGNDHPLTVNAMQSLSVALTELRNFPEAETLATEALEKLRQMRGNEHLSTLTCLNVLGQVLMKQNKFNETEPYFREAYQTGLRALGEDHPEVIVFTNNLAMVLQRQRRFPEAETLFRTSLEKNRKLQGDDHPYTITMTIYFADFLRQSRNPAEAEKQLRTAIDSLMRNAGGKENAEIINLIGTLGAVCRDLGKLPEAEVSFQKVIDWNLANSGPDHANTIVARLRMATLRVAQETHAEVIAILRPLDGKISKAFPQPAGDLRQASLKGMLGKSQSALAKEDADFKLAEAALLDARSTFSKLRTDKDIETVEWTKALVDFYTKWNEASPNSGHDKSAETWKAKLLPEQK